ncbi:MAG: cysteine--tRNA ligase [Nitrospirota bacterium]
MLKIHNTLTDRKEPFDPLVPGTVRMYVCGVTVYDYCHIGHARSALVFDVIRNYFLFRGYAVTFVKNFTDVDDKIINRAAREGVDWTEIVARYLRAYAEDMGRLGVKPADIEPRATEHIGDIIALIARLIAKGHAYQLDRDVYYQVETYPAYGRLSKRRAEDLLAGARVEVDERKRNPMDFALWKASKPGEPAWDSPWGPGRPGWHIECSAMAMRHLGETFDVHGGGMDLIFPHHENEIAQSCGATGREFARCWIHNGFVEINREKMSKSLGNFFTIREVFEKWGYRDQVTGEALRYFLLATHYRSPLDFSDSGLLEAKRALDGLYGLFQRLEEPSPDRGGGDRDLQRELAAAEAAFREAMDDDFNTPAALAQLQHLRAEINRLMGIGLSHDARRQARETFRRLGGVLGLFQLSVKDWEFKARPVTHFLQASAEGVATLTGELTLEPGITDEEIERRLAERNEARRRKDFARADAIRKELAARGVTIEDRPDGTSRWKQ